MNNILQASTARNMTQQQFADLLGVSSRTIQKWEKGARIPPAKKELIKRMLNADEHEAAAECGKAYNASSEESALVKALAEISELRKELCDAQSCTRRLLDLLERIMAGELGEGKLQYDANR